MLGLERYKLPSRNLTYVALKSRLLVMDMDLKPWHLSFPHQFSRVWPGSEEELAMAASFKDQIRCGTTCQRDSTPTESRFQVESYEDVTVALPLELDPKAQRVFAYLPVRSVGFKFAIQAPFHLTASRADLHRSPENLRRRNCVAKAFIKACAWDEFLFKFNGIHLFYQSTVLLMSTSKGLKPFHPKALFMALSI